MKRLLVLIPALLLAAPAFAQTAPEGSYRDLWCGLAFGAAAQSAPFSAEDVAAAKAAGDAATEEQKQLLAQQAMVDQFVSGGQTLVDKATTAYKGAGFTDEAFTKVRTDLEPKVTSQVSGNGDAAEFTFDECSALLPASATTGGAMAPDATMAPAPDANNTMAPAAGAMAPESTTTTAQ